MPIFEYRAFDLKGGTKRGTIDADTARDARERLRRLELRVTEIAQLEASTRRDRKVSQWKLTRRVGLRELAILTRQLATLLRSGVHLSEGLKVLIEQVEQRRTEIILRDLREKIVSGMAMAEALSFHPLYFSDLYINMVRAGEASGNLDEVLNRLADYLQAQASLKGKIVTALTYPAVMVVIGVSVVIFLMSYVVPKITETLLERDQVLPRPTQILIAISTFFKHYWWAAMIAVLAVMVAIRVFAATEKGRLAVDTLLLRLPLVGGLFKKQAISRFTVTLATLLKSGLPALEALQIVAAVVNNSLMTRVIGQVAERIIEGADISTPLRRSKLFPPMVAYMVAVGEQSGQLEEILDRISETYEEEVDLAIQRMTALAEPIIIVCLAVVVGFIILAVLLPLLQISQLRG